MKFSAEWLVMVLDTITAIYEQELQRKPDIGGLATYLHGAMYGGLTAESIREGMRASDEWKQLHAQAPAVPPATNPPVGRISRDGEVFTVNGTIFRPILASGFALATRSVAEQDAFIAWALKKGFNGIRVMVGALGWANQSAEAARNGLEALLAKLTAANLYAEVTLLTDTKAQSYDKIEHVKKLRTIIEKFDNVLVEMANEQWHPTQDDDVHNLNYLYDLAKLFGQNQLVALGATKSDEEVPAKFRDYITLHLDRTRTPWYDQIRRVREMEGVRNNARVPVINNEPIGAAEIAIQGKRLDDPEAFLTLGVLNRLFEVGGVFHFSDGLLAAIPGPVQDYCAEQFVLGSKLGLDLGRLTYKNTGFADGPVKSANFNNVTRVYAGLSGDRGIIVVVGGTWVTAEAVMQNGWRVVKPLHIGRQVDVLEIARG